ncbi:MAG: choice-of-anchor J domain-containing protein [Cyclobacteriaceae bacterium]|nr:choice-of-anchor J domain-containing protein [Cyclobacteriaceae bacterium]
MRHLLILLALIMQLTALHITVFAQEKCGTVPYMQQLRNEGKLRQTEEQFEKWMTFKRQSWRSNQQTPNERNKQTQGEPYQIPVVVHIIHNGEPIGNGTNISDAQILSQIEVINKDFKRLNTDAVNTPAEFQPVAGSLDVEFILARRDPNGLPTTGINRVQGTKTSWTMSDNAIFKSLSYWNSNDYLNIWVVKFSGSTIGYAQFPVSELEGLENYRDGLAATDGVAIDYLAFGTIDAGPFDLDPKFNKGRTATHEIGHFFGLRHIWGDANCGTDYVEDTPTQRSSTSNCPSHPQTTICGTSIVKMFQNYMDYTNDACMNIFTEGQIGRMETILNDDAVPRRKSLLTSPGLLDPSCTKIDVALLGVISPGVINCNPQAEFKINIRNVSCSAIASVKTVHSVNGGSSVSNTITFNTPLAINEQRTITIPGVNFSEGINAVSLQVTEADNKPDEDPNNSSLSINITVDQSQDRIPLRENFNALNWPIVNPQDGLAWQITATNFGNSASVQAFNNGAIGHESWLASPVLDFSNTAKASMFFDLSYAWNQTANDRFRILASTDCGVTYQPLSPPFDKSGSGLSNDISSNPWLPSHPSQWQQRNFINLNEFAGEKQVRLVFVFTNATGNNIYLDNIEFFVSDDPNPVDIGSDLYSIYWRSNFDATITFDLPERMPVGIYVVDIMGREYLNTTAPDILNQTFPIELNGAATGIYIMKIRIGNQFYTSKFFLSR